MRLIARLTNSSRCLGLLRILLLAVVTFAAMPATGQTLTGPDEFKTAVETVKNEVQALERSSFDQPVADSALAANRSALQRAAQKVFELAIALSAQLKRIDGQLSDLGPATDLEASGEAATIAAERQRLTAAKADATLILHETERLTVHIAAVIDRVVQLRSQKFADEIFSRNPLSVAVVHEARDTAAQEMRRLRFTFGNWARLLGSKLTNETMVASFLSIGIAIFIGLGVNRFLWPLVRRPLADTELPYLRRVFAALAAALVPSATVGAISAVVYLAFREMALLPPKIDEIFRGALISISLATFLLCLTHAILAPGRRYWRLLSMPETAASRITLLISLLSIVYVVDFFVATVRGAMTSPVAFAVISSFIATLLFALLLALILRTDVSPDDGDVLSRLNGWPFWFYWPIWLTIVLMVVAVFAGYVSFARFLAGQILVTGAILVAMYVAFLSARSISRHSAMAESQLGKYLTKRLQFSELTVDQLGLVSGALLFVCALAIGIPFILLQWGFQQDDVLNWVARALGGFQVGEVRISILNIMLAIAVFIAGLVLTRLFQRWFTSNVLTRTRIDPGVKNSVSAGLGYVGFIIAAIVALDYTGLDLSNLALIAGALSVGIGFGLQNVVNNFVSGIILLIERPIRVGDWIVVGNTEGYVKKISVRATELETFDRQSIVIPNAELINTSVGNWMLKDRTGRLIVQVGVSYDSNEEQVRDILYSLVATDDRIATEPAPYVYFRDFGDSALIFEVRAFLKDVSNIIRVGGDLRFAIRKAFREAGIEIPFPQRDIHIQQQPAQDVLADNRRKND